MFRLGLVIAFSLAVAVATESVTKRQSQTEDFQETVIFLKKQTKFGENVFIRGGVGNGKGCQPKGKPEDDPCAIPIRHLEMDIGDDVNLREEWAESDLFLTWGGSEDDQHRTANGTPAQWTTSDQSSVYFHNYNTYGEHYWMVHFDMDCSKLNDGFFDFKGYVNGRWENDIKQSFNCSGEAAKKPSYESKNHIARCGYVNVFEWGRSRCQIELF